MLPRLVLHVRKALKPWPLRGALPAMDGAEIASNWDAMLAGLDAERREAEYRLVAAEAALNHQTPR